MKAVNPYLNFRGNTEEAFQFYQSVFGGELLIVRFRQFAGKGMNVPEEHLDKIAHIALPLTEGSMLMGTDALEEFVPNLTAGNNFSITLEAESEEEAERLMNALSEGGQIRMPLAKTGWADKFGDCIDRFGIQWMVNYTGSAQLVPGE